MSGPSVADAHAPSRPFVYTLLIGEQALYAAITPLLPHYQRVLGFSKAEVGLLAGIYAAGLIPGSLVGTWSAARVGPHRTILVGLLLLAGSSLAFGFGDTAVTLVLARSVQGLGSGCIWGGSMTWLIGATTADRRGRVLGGTVSAAIVGTLVGPLLGLLALAVGTRPAFGAIGVAAAAIAVWGLRLPGTAPPARAAGVPVRHAVRRPPVVVGIWAIAVLGVTVGAINALVPLALKRHGASDVAIGATFVIAALVTMAAAPAIGRMNDHRGPSSSLRIACLVAAAMLALIAIVSHAVLLAGLTVLTVGLASTGLIVSASSFLTSAADRAGVTIAGGIGLLNFVWAIGETAGAPASAALAEHVGDAAPFLSLAGLMVLTAVLVSRLR